MPLNSFDKVPYHEFQDAVEEWVEETKRKEEQRQKEKIEMEKEKQKSRQNMPKMPNMPGGFRGNR